MTTHRLQLIACFLLAPVFIAPTGCTTVKDAASDAISWIRGALEIVVDQPIDKVSKAATGAVTHLKFTSIESKLDTLTGEITAQTAQETKVQILLKKIGEKTTQISIRVGVFGDEALSRQINAEIAKRL